MLQTTLNEIKLAEHLRDYDRGIERAEMLRTVNDLYWAWRLEFEDDLETDAEIEEFYLNLDELDQIVSNIECGMSTLDEMISFLRGNGCSFILSKEVINQYA